jgi:hypothetical protein
MYRIVLLCSLFVYCVLIFRRRIRTHVLPVSSKPILFRFIVTRFGMLACAGIYLLWWYKSQLLFAFPKSKPITWGVFFLFYPVLSAWPQEFMYRAFYFARYQAIFRNRYAIGLTSALTYSLVHIMYHNAVALLFSLVAGIIFSHTYLTSRSLKLVWFEHTIYGLYTFTVGWGFFFYRALI